MERFVMNTQWQTYQKLELIPDSIPAPPTTQPGVLSWLNDRWRSLLGNLIENFTPEQQIDHLEKCLELENLQSTMHPNLWQRIWDVLNQPLSSEEPFFIQPEPQIKRIADQEGHIWWQAYDPITRQITYLDSEEEVQIWLEERLHF